MFISYKNIHEIFPNDYKYATLNLTQTIDIEASPSSSPPELTRPKRIINSNLISFKMNDKSEMIYLKENPIELVFKHLRTDIFDTEMYLVKPFCAYLDYNRE
jgi:hypothetical protein